MQIFLPAVLFMIAISGASACRKLAPQSALEEGATNAAPLFTSLEQHAQFLQTLPQTTDGFIDELKANYRIEFYNDELLHQVLQYSDPSGSASRKDNDGVRGSENGSTFKLPNPPVPRWAYTGKRNATQAMFEAIYDLGINFTLSDDPVGNPNNEFPWLRSVGTDFTKGIEQLKFIAMKPNAKIVYQRKDIGAQTTNVIPEYLTWEFPEETVAGELLFMNTSAGKILFEFRISKKTGRRWFGRAYRPFAKPYQLADALEQLADGATLKPIAASIRSQTTVKTEQLSFYTDPVHLSRNVVAPQALAATATTLDLPAINCDTLAQIMKRPFMPVNGRPFYAKDGKFGFAPITQAECQIVPRRYFGHFLEVKESTCLKCHQTVLGDALYFAGNPINGQRDRFWYGRVRGSDHVFTFHLFDPSWVSSKERKAAQPGKFVDMINPKLASSGVIVEGETGNVFFPGYPMPSPTPVK